jgi:esterase
MDLNFVEHGGGDGPPLLIAHGLFGSARNWNGIARRLAEGRRVVAADLRNHGASPWSDDHSYEAMAEDLGALVDRLGGRVDLLGHSMGGKAAMILALLRPEAVGRLIVADMAPVAYRHSQMPYVEAMRRLDLSGVSRRSEADRRLAADIPDRALRAFLLQNLAFENGRPRWMLNLDALARDMERIMGFPPIDRRFEGPALFLRGAASDYVSAEGEAAARRLFPQARFETLAGAGHWLHAEQPEAFTAAVGRFLTA